MGFKIARFLAPIHLRSLEVNNRVPIIRVPCLTHVIQLSLRELLGHVKADPKNDVASRELSSTQIQSFGINDRKTEIANTLAEA